MSYLGLTPANTPRAENPNAPASPNAETAMPAGCSSNAPPTTARNPE
jgi:hypothetical protein